MDQPYAPGSIRGIGAAQRYGAQVLVIAAPVCILIVGLDGWSSRLEFVALLAVLVPLSRIQLMSVSESGERPDRNPHHWDVVQSADKLGALAGILAGFAFTALVIVLSQPPPKLSGATVSGTASVVPVQSAIELMVSAFFSLIVAAFVFGILAGYGPAIGRFKPYVAGFFASWILALATVELCLCTVWLVSAYQDRPEVIQTGRLIVFMAVVITSWSLSGVPLSPLFQQLQMREGAWALIVVSLVPMSSIYLGQYTLQSLNLPIQWVVGGSIVSTTAVSVLYGIVDSRPEDQVQRAYQDRLIRYGLIGVLVLVLAVVYSTYIRLLPH